MDATLTRIAVYPVKSTRGTALASAEVEPWGLAGDRRWAVVDAHGRRVRAIRCPAVLSITATPQGDGGLLLAAPRAAQLTVPVPAPTAPSVAVTVSRLDRAVDAGPAAAAWLSAVLDAPVRLVWLDDPTRRPVSPDHGGWPGEPLSLADTAPLLLTSTASLRQLDGWIAAGAAERGEPAPPPLDMRRFRPNVVIDTDVPFAEETWRRVRIGEVTFRVSEHCDRCAVTLIEPDSLARGREPVRTLARHRRRDNGKVYFGVRLVPETPGRLRVGDEVAPDPD